MHPEEVKKILESALPKCNVSVEGEGDHYNIKAVGEIFEGLRALKRQQLIYDVLNSYIADGSIHAVNMTTLTPAEAQRD